MSDEIDVTPALFDLQLRNRAAEEVIRTFATEHAAVDAGSGFLMGLFPAGNLVALASQLIYSASSNYPRMIRKLAVIYGASQDDFTRTVIIGNTLVEGGVDALLAAVGPDVLGAAAIDLVNEFGSEFFKEIFWELAREGGLATGMSLVPVVGSFVGAGLDALLGATMTWRVGAAVSAYYQNGGYLGSRRETYNAVKPYVGLSPKLARPGTLEEVGNIEAIRNRKKDFARSYVKAHRRILDKAALRGVLVDEWHVPADIVDEVLKES